MSKKETNIELGARLHMAMEKIMAGKTHLSLAQLKKDIAEMLPTASVGRDAKGQLVIYTGMQADEKGKLFAWVPDDV